MPSSASPTSLAFSAPRPDDLARARGLLAQGGLSVVAVRGQTLLTSSERGVAPLVSWVDEGRDLSGFCVADRVVGKAPALLYALLGPAAVFSPVMSGAAVEVLEAHGIAATCDERVETIINRAGTGQCPMDAAVAGIDGPHEALHAIREVQARLRTAS